MSFPAITAVWSLFLIKLQAWHLFWRISANNCFCTKVALPFYFIFSNFLIITATTVTFPMFVFGSNGKSFKEFKYGISFSVSHFQRCYFHFHVFLSFSVLFHFFLSLLIKRILLSWELIKMFLRTLRSVKYIYVSK